MCPFAELPLELVSPLEDQVAIKKEAAKFKCKLSKENQAVKWYKNTQEIRSSEKFSITSEGQVYELHVASCEKADAGEYAVKCGPVRSAAALEVKGSFSVFELCRKFKKLPLIWLLLGS